MTTATETIEMNIRDIEAKLDYTRAELEIEPRMSERGILVARHGHLIAELDALADLRATELRAATKP